MEQNKSEIAGSAKKIAPVKAQKMKYEIFINGLAQLVADKSEKKLSAKIYNYLKMGFDGAISPDKTDEVFKLILNAKCYPLIALKISLDVGCGSKSSELFKRLMRRNREEAAKRSNFPTDAIPLFSNVNDRDRKKNMENWVNINAYRADNLEEWARNAIICLISEDLISDEFDTIRVICQKLFPKDNSNKSVTVGNKYRKFINEVGTIFLQDNISKQKLVHLYDLIRVFEIRYEDIRQELKVMNDKTDVLIEKKIELENKKSELEVELKQANLLMREQNEALILKDSTIQNEQDKYVSLEDYWQHESVREKASFLHSLNVSLTHEVNEARLSLEGDCSDIEMALSRLRNMENILERMTSEHEK